MKHILHMEDDTDFHCYIDAALSNFVNVTSVCTASEFRDALTGFHFDLFLLNQAIKDSSGSGLATELRSRYPDTPIVILSAEEILSEYIDDIDAMFAKPELDIDTFAAKIQVLLAVSEENSLSQVTVFSHEPAN